MNFLQNMIIKDTLKTIKKEDYDNIKKIRNINIDLSIIKSIIEENCNFDLKKFNIVIDEILNKINKNCSYELNLLIDFILYNNFNDEIIENFMKLINNINIKSIKNIILFIHIYSNEEIDIIKKSINEINDYNKLAIIINELENNEIESNIMFQNDINVTIKKEINYKKFKILAKSKEEFINLILDKKRPCKSGYDKCKYGDKCTFIHIIPEINCNKIFKGEICKDKNCIKNNVHLSRCISISRKKCFDNRNDNNCSYVHIEDIIVKEDRFKFIKSNEEYFNIKNKKKYCNFGKNCNNYNCKFLH